MSTTRTFVAVDLAATVQNRAAELIAALAYEGDGVKWVAPENLHLTLKFLGDVPHRDLPEVCEAVARAVADRPPFEISLCGANAFPHIGRPRTLWLGVDEGGETLGRVQKSIESALRQLGFPRENRQFHPHLTIGRVRRPSPGLQRLTEALRDQQAFSAGYSTIDQVVVYASHLARHGPTYQPLSRALLKGASCGRSE